MTTKSLSLLVALGCTLSAGCASYQREDGRPVFVSWDEGVGRRVKPVVGVQEGGLRGIGGSEYAVDSVTVFFRGERVTGAEPQTFRRLSGDYWRDSKAVYLHGEMVQRADPASFRRISGYHWAKDRKDIYTGIYPLGVKDGSTFRLINSGWGKDSVAYYANSVVIKQKGRVDCDYQSMQVLNQTYAKDRFRAYYQGEPMNGVDPSTFCATSFFTAKDKNCRYEFWEVAR